MENTARRLMDIDRQYTTNNCNLRGLSVFHLKKTCINGNSNRTTSNWSNSNSNSTLLEKNKVQYTLQTTNILPMSSGSNETNGSGHTKNNGGTVTLPLEEVLRLTTLQDDDSEHYQLDETTTTTTQLEPRNRRYSRNNNNNRVSTTSRSRKESDFEREKPKRTKSGSSTSSRGSRKLKKAVKNERKSVDKVVAAAIRKYEEYDQSPNNSLRKTRTTPGRTKSGSSSSNGKKTKSSSEEQDYSKKKGRKKNTTHENAPERRQARDHEQSQDAPAEGPVRTESRDSSSHSAGSSARIDAAGAIAVYPSDSNKATTRLDRSDRPNRVSVAGNFLTSSEFNQIDATAYEEEEIPVPPESQIIDAVVTVRNPHHRSQESPTISDLDTLTTAPTVATTVVRDAESGTVTATAVSSENYYQQIRRQLQQEAVSAVAVIPLHEDESIHNNNNKKRSKSINDVEMQNAKDRKAKKDRGKKGWVCCAIATFVIFLVSIIGARAAIRKKSASSNTSVDCEDDMACRMDTIMSSDAGQYWREKLLQILPRSTLVNILEDANFMSPQYMALDFVTSNTETLFGFSLDEMMDMDMVGEFTDVELSRMTTLFALVTLYHSMDGEGWYVKTNWLDPEVDLCDWEGVECHGDSIPTPVSRPILGNRDEDDDGALLGTLVESFQMDDERDGFFANKLKFHSLNLMANNLSGSIPEEISLLSNIYGQINLSRNNIYGSIPDDMSKLSKLQAIRLDRNDLSSTVPPEIADLRLLRAFDISHNPRITGDVSYFGGWNKIGTF